MPFQCGRHRYVARLIARERSPSELLEDITRGIVVDEGGEDEDDMGEDDDDDDDDDDDEMAFFRTTGSGKAR
jgi:hypothetical protein